MREIPDLLRAGLIGLNTVCVLVNTAGRILEHDPLFPTWIAAEQDRLAGRPLTDVLPEFIGMEPELEQVRRAEKPYLRVEHSARAGESGQVRYLTFTVVAGRPDTEVALLVLVTDVTEQGVYLQELTQNRNELRLTRRKLAQLSYQLDYLLRHYVPADVADALLAGDLKPDLGGELRPVSILFADVRGFTSLAEQLAPEPLVQHLNDYLHVVAEAINEAGGTISQFQGDNLLAIFNAPRNQPDHALRAVQAGLSLQQALASYQAQQPPHEARLNFGVGINTGPALIGNLGAQWRYSYTAIGDTVNLAARITGAVPAGEIWISNATRQHLPQTVAVEPLPAITFKGKSQTTTLYRVLSAPPSRGD